MFGNKVRAHIEKNPLLEKVVLWKWRLEGWNQKQNTSLVIRVIPLEADLIYVSIKLNKIPETERMTAEAL